MTTQPSTNDLKTHLAKQGSNVLGAIVAWTLAGFVVPRDAFREAMEGIGIGNAVGRDPKPITLARAAIADAQAGHPDTLIRQITKDEHKVEWGVVKETRDAQARELHHDQTTRIALFGATGALEVEDGEHPVAARVRSRYEYRRQHVLTADVSKTVINAILRDMQGLKIAGRGGAYFIRPEHLDTLRALGQWAEATGNHDTIFTVLEITGEGDNLAQAGKRAAVELSQKVREVLAETRQFVADLRAKEPTAEVPEKVMEVRMRRFQELRETATLYRDILMDLEGQVADEIAAARAEVLGLQHVGAEPSFEDEPAAPAAAEPAQAPAVPADDEDTFAFDEE